MIIKSLAAEQVSGRIFYADIFDFWAVSLCFYILLPGGYPIILDQVSGRIADADGKKEIPIHTVDFRHFYICMYIYIYIL